MLKTQLVVFGVIALASATPLDHFNLHARQNASGGGAAATGSVAGSNLILSSKVTGAIAKTNVDLAAGKTAAENPDTYTFFKGDGSAAQGWPTEDEWINFNDMFTRNNAAMGKGCPGGVTENTAAENEDIRVSIIAVASAAAVDPRFVLAAVMQESNGCVRVQGTPSGEAGVFNPGIMQSFRGTGTCNVGNSNQLSPCPPETITQMIVDGVQGVNVDGQVQAGLVQQLTAAGGDPSGQNTYRGARGYNSGAISGALENAGQCGPPRTFGVPCYSSDIANRLKGWVSAPTQCNLQPQTC
ncbi:hypothetical protein B0T24DRAFT_700329 [Lasiosphaeria ovina]|uniref:Uncharacterized protein n=1 Tax=Lasiosphaeria ovina TaxID=92902 RepID=A0AAE0KHZ6_9PEZI|nr:hypothetical protein B0T24DRAFT_700329 [Lasiosphaeria ovina]